MKKILLTAFEPFGGEKINPALEAVKLVKAPAGVELTKLTVPTSFKRSAECVLAAIGSIEPDVVLCVGQAGGRKAITPERVAINLDDAKICDNDGNMPHDTPIVKDAPAAYFATLPVKKIAAALNETGIAAEVSYSAGTFVCNHLMYSVLHCAAQERPAMQAGFIHVPYIPEQTRGKCPETPSMPLESIARGLEIALEILENEP